jgi:tetratricopeptide (TPR) repeat protein
MWRTNYPFKCMLTLLLLSHLTVHAYTTTPWQPAPQQQPVTESKTADEYLNEAMTYYNQGQIGMAINSLQQALKQDPENITYLNNLAASYIKRGVVSQNQYKNYASALSDYRQAGFYLKYPWAQNSTAQREGNLEILKSNIENAMLGLRINPRDAVAQLNLAQQLRAKGNIIEALMQYDWVTQISPQNTTAWMALGDLLNVKQLPQKSLAAYQRVLDLADKNNAALIENAMVKLATVRYKLGQPDQAVDLLGQVLNRNGTQQEALLTLESIWQNELKTNPRNASAHLNLGVVYQQMNRFEEAMAQYQIAQQLEPSNSVVKQNIDSLLASQNTAPQNAVTNLLEKAQQQEKQALAKAAIESYEAVLKLDPSVKAAYEGLLILTEKQPELQANVLDRYRKAFANDSAVQYNSAIALHELKHYPQALEAYQRSIQLKPDWADAWANMGSVLNKLNQPEAAKSALNKALVLNPNLLQAKSLLAQMQNSVQVSKINQAASLYEARKFSEAAQAFQALLSQDPNNTDLLARYGLALQAQGKLNDAALQYTQAHQLDPHNADIVFYQGTVLQAQNNIEGAKKSYQDALSLNPQLKDAKNALQSLSQEAPSLDQVLEAYTKKQYKQALNLLKPILKEQPDDSDARYYEGLIYDAQKQYAPAQMAYETALKQDANNTDVLYALAVNLDAQNKKSEAKKRYTQFLSLSPAQDTFTTYAKTRLKQLK